MLPASSFKLFESLLGLTIKGEKAIATEVWYCAVVDVHVHVHVIYIIHVC